MFNSGLPGLPYLRPHCTWSKAPLSTLTAPVGWRIICGIHVFTHSIYFKCDSLFLSLSMCAYIYIYHCVCVCVCVRVKSLKSLLRNVWFIGNTISINLILMHYHKYIENILFVRPVKLQLRLSKHCLPAVTKEDCPREHIGHLYTLEQMCCKPLRLQRTQGQNW